MERPAADGTTDDYIGAPALLSSLPSVKWLLGDRDCDVDWCIEALSRQRDTRLYPWLEATQGPIKYDKRRYKRRNRPS
jgi:hypothetical protein